MSVTQRILKNTVFLISGQIFAKMVNLALILMLTRFLGVAGFGIYSFGFAYCTLFVLLVHLGINSLIVREIAKHKDQKSELISVTFPVLLIMSFFVVIIINIIAGLSAWPHIERIVIALFSLYVIFETICRYFIAVIRAHEEMQYEALFTIGERFSMLILTIVIWYTSRGLIDIVAGYTTIQLLRLILLYKFIRQKYVKFHIEFDRQRITDLLKQSYPFALTGIFATISTRIDLVMIRLFHSVELSGVYNAARKLMESLTFIPENIYFAVFPVLSVYYLRDRSFFNITFQRVFLILCIISLPLNLGIFLYADQIIKLFFQSAFSAAATPLRWLSFALAIIFVKHSFAVSLNAIGKQHLFSLFTGISMLINISLNLVLIPRYDMMGAALATTFSEFVTLILAAFSLRNIVNYRKYKWNLYRLIMVMGIMLAILFYLQNQMVDFVLTLAISIIFYIFLIYFFRVISKRDYSELLLLLNRKFSLAASPAENERENEKYK